MQEAHPLSPLQANAVAQWLKDANVNNALALPPFLAQSASANVLGKSSTRPLPTPPNPYADLTLASPPTCYQS